MSKPSPTNYPGYFQLYIDQVTETDFFTALENQSTSLEQFLQSITEEKSMFAYAEGKWTIKEMLLHMSDTERIFCYRALCFARGEKTNLPGFDENDYAANSDANSRTWESIVQEFLIVRKATEVLFKNFSEKALAGIGTANNNPATVASIGFILLGHFNHHKKILVERYL